MSDNAAAEGLMFGLRLLLLGAIAVGVLIGGVVIGLIWLICHFLF